MTSKQKRGRKEVSKEEVTSKKQKIDDDISMSTTAKKATSKKASPKKTTTQSPKKAAPKKAAPKKAAPKKADSKKAAPKIIDDVARAYQQANKDLDDHFEELSKVKGFVSVGVGAKIKDGECLEQLAIIVFVEKKGGRIPASQQVPKKLGGTITDVVEQLGEDHEEIE